MNFLRNFGTLGLILVMSLAALDVYFARQVFGQPGGAGAVREYFLDVGAGESELIALRSGALILIDAGPAGALENPLAAALPPGSRYIDLAVISYPAPGLFGGLADLLDHYEVGSILWSGRMPGGPAAGGWQDLLAKAKAKNVPIITVGAGDRIRIGADEIDILSPDPSFLRSADPSESSIVALAGTGGLRTLFMGTAGMSVERRLAAQGMDLRADVLKAAASGASYATGEAFLRAVRPAAVVIEAGGTNAAALPAKTTLLRISSCTDAYVFRTDMDGTAILWPGSDGTLHARTSK